VDRNDELFADSDFTRRSRCRADLQRSRRSSLSLEGYGFCGRRNGVHRQRNIDLGRPSDQLVRRRLSRPMYMASTSSTRRAPAAGTSYNQVGGCHRRW
jgi:hypothetical protein